VPLTMGLAMAAVIVIQTIKIAVEAPTMAAMAAAESIVAPW